MAEQENGYLAVDYGGLAVRLGEAMEELTQRVNGMDDAGLREVLSKLNLDASPDAPLSGTDYRALIGALVETVKDLDARVEALERGTAD